MAVFLITFLLAVLVILGWFALDDSIVPLASPHIDSFLVLDPIYIAIAVVFIAIMVVICMIVVIRHTTKKQSKNIDQ